MCNKKTISLSMNFYSNDLTILKLLNSFKNKINKINKIKNN